MPPPPRKRNPLWPVSGLVLLAAAAVTSVMLTRDRPWDVPPEAAARPNPLPAGEAALRIAAPLYGQKCQKCHGEAGRGDGVEAAAYGVRPADFAGAATAAQTDGELFYKISVGRRPMPAYEDELSERERWALVHLIRSFAAPQAEPPQGAAGRPPGEQ